MVGGATRSRKREKPRWGSGASQPEPGRWGVDLRVQSSGTWGVYRVDLCACEPTHERSI
jgi:hypothetical protein